MRLALAQDRGALHGVLPGRRVRPRAAANALARLALLVLAAGPAAAQTTMTPRRVRGAGRGPDAPLHPPAAPYGAEQFLAGRRSLWRYADGTCVAGRWWDEGDAICFRYEADPTPQCWRFLPRPGGVAAELVEGGAGTGFVVEMERTDEAPLPCPGPDLGS